VNFFFKIHPDFLDLFLFETFCPNPNIKEYFSSWFTDSFVYKKELPIISDIVNTFWFCQAARHFEKLFIISQVWLWFRIWFGTTSNIFQLLSWKFYLVPIKIKKSFRNQESQRKLFLGNLKCVGFKKKPTYLSKISFYLRQYGKN